MNDLYLHDENNEAAEAAAHGFLTTEDCSLTLNYAWYHVLGCSGLLWYLYKAGRTEHFEAGHTFGIFAMLVDYGIMYSTHGTRTFRVLPYNNGIDVDDLHGIGAFLFFGWFDYLGGFALLVFARSVADAIGNGKLDRVQAMVIFSHTLQWWTAPMVTVPNDWNHHQIWLPEWLDIDPRRLVLSRSSPKSNYGLLFVIFSILLFKTTSCSKRQYLGILGAGLACGFNHHLALYLFGMRGYDSLLALGVTMATEWPALLCGETFVRHHLAKHSRLGRHVLLAVLLAAVVRNLPGEQELAEFLISVVPGQHMQSLGEAAIRAQTCGANLPPPAASWCLASNDIDDDDSIWVVSTPAKSGAVLSAKILIDIATECNLCLGSGTRDAAGIPGPGTHVPSYKSKLLHAIMDMDEWPRYVEEHSRTNTSRCVSITRDPLNRLRSFYTYSRSGGEHWVRYETDIMDSLRNAPTLEDSVRLFWKRIGRNYLEASHQQYLKDERRGCYRIEFEELTREFDASIRRILTVFGIPSPAQDRLVEKLRRHDRSNTTRTEERSLAKDLHVSSKKFSPELLREVERILLEDIEVAGRRIQSMRKEMEGLTPAPPASSSP